MAKCAVCHGKEGAGDGPDATWLGPKTGSFRDRAMVAEMSDAYWFWRVSEGGLAEPYRRAFCARCVARELPADAPLIRAALEVLATRQICSRGPCACETVGLSYGWSVGRRQSVVYQRDERQYVVCETCGFGVSAPLPKFSPHPL